MDYRTAPQITEDMAYAAGDSLIARLHASPKTSADLNRSILARRSLRYVMVGGTRMIYNPAEAAGPIGEYIRGENARRLKARCRQTDDNNWYAHCEERVGHRWNDGFSDGRDMGARCLNCGAREE